MYRRGFAGATIAALLAAAATVTVFALSWSGGPSPEKALADTIQKMEALTSFRLKGEMEMTAAGQTLTADVEGAMAMASQSPTAMSMEMRATMDIPSEDTFTMEQRVVDGRYYMKMDPDLAGGEPQWYVLPTEMSRMQFQSSAGGSPTDYIKYLRAFSDVDDRGTETIAGVDCNHYCVRIDGAKLADLMIEELEKLEAQGQTGMPMPPQAKTDIRKLYESADMSVELYVGVDDMLPRREIVDMTMNTYGQEMSMNMTVDIFDYDAPIDIEAPEGAVPLPASANGIDVES